MTTQRAQAEQDPFPSTDMTWLGRSIRDGERGRLAAGEHVMRIYADPLRVYLRGSSFRSLDDADDLVNGFFASRLSRERFLHDWLSSGRPLHRWLIVGFRHYLFETARRRSRWRQRRHDAPEAAEPAERAFHRESALALVREALRMAHDRCRDQGLHEHWRIFLAHHMDGRAYEQIVPDQRRAAVMARTAANRFRAALREIVGWPGATEEQIDDEIRALMEETAR